MDGASTRAPPSAAPQVGRTERTLFSRLSGTHQEGAGTMIRELMDGSRALLVGVVALVALAGSATLIEAQAAGNAACAGEEVFYNPGSAQDIIVPAGYKVEVFAKGLNFPTNIAFLGDNPRRFQAFGTEAGTSWPGRCNGVEFYKAQTGVADSANPFLPQVRILDQTGQTHRG